MRSVIELAKECGVHEYGPLTRNWSFELSQLERFAALVRAEREWVDLTDDEIEQAVLSVNSVMEAWITYRAVIAAFKAKQGGCVTK